LRDSLQKQGFPSVIVELQHLVTLATDIWVGALIRRAQLAGAFATVVRKGDPTAGAVLVKSFNPRTREASLFASAFRGEGERVWMQPVASNVEPDLDAFVEKQSRYDPDIWVVEIEDANGRHFLTEPVEER
jgi:hypothetical protein